MKKNVKRLTAYLLALMLMLSMCHGVRVVQRGSGR